MIHQHSGKLRKFGFVSSIEEKLSCVQVELGCAGVVELNLTATALSAIDQQINSYGDTSPFTFGLTPNPKSKIQNPKFPGHRPK